MSLTRPQRIILSAIHVGKVMVERNDRYFFEERPGTTLYSNGIEKLMQFGFICRDSEDAPFKLGQEGVAAIKRMKKKPEDLVLQGFEKLGHPYHEAKLCAFCAEDLKKKRHKNPECHGCTGTHRVCMKCYRKRQRITGEFPAYEVKLRVCPAPASSPPQPHEAGVTPVAGSPPVVTENPNPEEVQP